MCIDVLAENSIFVYSPTLDCVWGTINLLMGEPTHTLCAEIYGSEQIAVWKRKYNFLFEAFQAIATFAPSSMIDFLLDMPTAEFTLECYRDRILAVSEVDFLWRVLDLHYRSNSNKCVLTNAITDDAALDEAFSWVADHCSSFLAFAALVRQSRRYIVEFFALASELNGEKLEQAFLSQRDKIEQMRTAVRSGVSEGAPLAFSELQMGKTFRNRGPYSEFLFMPSYLMPYTACRFFHTQGETKRQILFLTLRTSYRKQADTVKSLKAIADGTRYQILVLLAKRGTMRGLEIAQALDIATSTVSHHMDQLKESGLITEEPVKNSKYYGLNKQNAQELIKELSYGFRIDS